MAARSSFTRTSGGVITSAWANSMRDHLIPYSGAADGVTEGMLSVNTATDQLRIGTGATTVQFGCYGTPTAITAGMTQTGFSGSFTTSGEMVVYGNHVVASGFSTVLSVITPGTAGNIIELVIAALPIVSSQRCVGSYVFRDASTSSVYGGAVIMATSGAIGMYGSTSALGVTPSLGIAVDDTVWFSINYIDV